MRHLVLAVLLFSATAHGSTCEDWIGSCDSKSCHDDTPKQCVGPLVNLEIRCEDQGSECYEQEAYILEEINSK
jgi:hypothetical protein